MSSISGLKVGNMYRLDIELEDRYRRHLLTVKSILRKKSIKETVKELIDKELASYFNHD
ncbi:MAG: hypothetical protein ACTSUF_03405 [Candidatus Heimdallarchaeaceae archaeon]